MKTLREWAFADRGAIAVEILGWPLFLAALYHWLSIPEAKVLQVGLTLVLALVLAAMLTYLVAAAFTAAAPRWKAALARVPRVFPVVALWCLALFLLVNLIEREWWRWAVLALSTLAFAPLCAAGWRGYQRLRHGMVWVALGLFLVIGLYVPWRLIWWVPKIEGLTGQAVSAGIRFVIAGLLFALAWLMLGGAFSASAPEPPAFSEDPVPAVDA
jgi:hypothetical protein